MRRGVSTGAHLRALLICAICTAIVGSFPRGAKAAEEIGWASSFATAMEQAGAENKFVMVDFYTHWCHWCKVLDSKTYSDPKVIDMSRKLVSVKVNAESEVKVAQKYGIRAYPTIVFLNPDGTLRQRVQGFQPPESMVPIMQDVLRTETELAALTQQVKDNPKDAGLRRSYARTLAQAGRYQDATTQVELLLDGFSLAGEEKSGLELDRWIYLQRIGNDDGKARKGLEGWVKKQKKHPRWIEARYYLARAEEQSGRDKQARKLYEQIAKDRPGSWFAEIARNRLKENS